LVARDLGERSPTLMQPHNVKPGNAMIKHQLGVGLIKRLAIFSRRN
jgi:hypothetical protein